MELKQPVVTLEGFSARARAGPIKLDNVVIDNIGPRAVAAEFADIRLGPGTDQLRAHRPRRHRDERNDRQRAREGVHLSRASRAGTAPRLAAVKRMVRVRFRYLAPAIVLLLAVIGGACSSEMAENGSLRRSMPNPELACGLALDGTFDPSLGLIGYSCTGSARPDEQATLHRRYSERQSCAPIGVPSVPTESKVIAVPTGATQCAYNPVVGLRSARLTAINATARIGRNRSIRPSIADKASGKANLINYCCSGTQQPDGCLQSDSVRCSSRLIRLDLQRAKSSAGGATRRQQEPRRHVSPPLSRSDAGSQSGLQQLLLLSGGARADRRFVRAAHGGAGVCARSIRLCLLRARQAGRRLSAHALSRAGFPGPERGRLSRDALLLRFQITNGETTMTAAKRSFLAAAGVAALLGVRTPALANQQPEPPTPAGPPSDSSAPPASSAAPAPTPGTAPSPPAAALMPTGAAPSPAPSRGGSRRDGSAAEVLEVLAGRTGERARRDARLLVRAPSAGHCRGTGR